RAVEVDQRLLYRMERTVGALQVLDGDDMAAVERAEEADAGIDAFIDKSALRQPPDEHGAGAAVAFRAAFLAAAQRAPQPQEIEQRLIRPHIGEGDFLAVEQEAEVGADHGDCHRTPPSVLPDISPSRGEISRRT